jgi:hypothetical protein
MREIVCPICNGAERTMVFAANLPPDFDEATQQSFMV